MSKKKLLAINLNEFNLEFLNYGSKKYNCKNIIKFLKLQKIRTYSSDKIQDKNLDPWVQSISINSGIKSKKHKIYNLGENIPENINQIWDLLTRKKINSAVWGPMNTKFKNNNFLKIFFPDPWNYENIVKPVDLKYIYKLAQMYANNYTSDTGKLNLYYLVKSSFYLLKKVIFFELLKDSHLFFSTLMKNGLKNYILFFLFDIISILIFKNITKSKKINFSLLFLNSLAHFQHNNWDNKKEEEDYFLFTDYIFKIIFDLSNHYDSLIIYNGFSQKKISTQYLIRPKNPKQFMLSCGIKFNNFHSNMTNGAILTFKNKQILNNEMAKIKNINVEGFQLYEVKVLNNLQLFCRVQIRSKKKINSNSSNHKLKKNFFYEKKNYLRKENKHKNIKEFLNQIYFIKTTSKHIAEGELFFKNIEVNKKRIENIKIYNLIKNYF